MMPMWSWSLILEPVVCSPPKTSMICTFVILIINYTFSKLWLKLKVSDGLNYVGSLMFNRSKPKMGCLNSITNRWICLDSFNIQKNDVRVSFMCNLINLVKTLLGSMFVRWKPKIECSISIINRWAHSSLFDVQKIIFGFVRCSIKCCSTHRYWKLSNWRIKLNPTRPDCRICQYTISFVNSEHFLLSVWVRNDGLFIVHAHWLEIGITCSVIFNTI